MFNNPYAQAGWPNANQSAVFSPPFGSNQPSIYGALPFGGSTPTTSIIAFRFAYSPSIMNCTVTGPDSRPYFRISTDAPRPGFTIMFDVQGKPIVVIEWAKNPILEIRDIVPKQQTSHWMPLSPQRNARAMEVKGKRYVWAPGDNVILLYNTLSNPPEILAKVTSGSTSALLEITAHAMHAGLTEASIVATFLLLSGRNID